MVETIDKQCDVRQEEEYDDESMQVGLSFIDPEPETLARFIVALQRLAPKGWIMKVL